MKQPWHPDAMSAPGVVNDRKQGPRFIRMVVL